MICAPGCSAKKGIVSNGKNMIEDQEHVDLSLDSHTDIEFCWYYYDLACHDPSDPDYLQVQQEEIVEFINSYPDAKFEISGHTDLRGSEMYNKKLSNSHASRLRNTLIRKGVDFSRLKAVGYGVEKPIIENALTEEEHAQNRRIEIRFLK